MPIQSFRNKETEEIANGGRTKGTVKLIPADLHYLAYKKLVFLDNTKALENLRSWPGLRLEKLSGNRAGQYSIRINEKYRICFHFVDGQVLEVEIVDYH